MSTFIRTAQQALATLFFAVALVAFCIAWLPSYRLLDEVKLVGWEHTHGKLKSLDESTLRTKDPVLRYTYEVDGIRHEGNQAFAYSSVMEGDRRSLQQRLHKAFKSEHRQISVYYDAGQPQRSFLSTQYDFDADMQTLGISMTCCIFAILLGFMVKPDAKARPVPLKSGSPSDPWNDNPEWRNGVLSSSSGDFGYLAAPLGFVITFMPLLPIIAEYGPRLGDDPLNRLPFLTFVVGLLILVPGLLILLKHLKHGKVVFNLLTIPGVKGGQLCGELVIPGYLQADEIEFHLTCTKTVIRNNDGSGEPHILTENIWQTDTTVSERIVATKQRTEVPVCFNIPYNVKQSTVDTLSPRCEWKLHARAEAIGLNLSHTFDVPIFETSDSDPDFNPDSCSTEPSKNGDNRTPHEISESAARQKITINAKETELTVSMGGFRIKSVCISTPIIALVTIYPLPPVAIIAILYWMELWFGSHRLRVDGRNLWHSRRLFGAGRTKRVPVDEIADISPVPHGFGRYTLKVSLTDGKTFEVLPNIVTKREALAIGKLIMAYCRQK